MAMLEVKNLEVYYGVIQAIKGISFEVNEGEVIALIGANGAGKTTTLQTITGMLSPAAGEIIFEGCDISKIPGHKIVSMGMAHVPEGRRVFAELSVYENLKLGAYTRKDKQEIAESLAKVYESFPRLEERKNQLAGTLSGGEQQMLAMGRALMSKPKIILMDEPSMGLSPILVEEIFHIIREISAGGTTVLLVEQNAKKALSIADRAYVLETGNIVLSGDAKEMTDCILSGVSFPSVPQHRCKCRNVSLLVHTFLSALGEVPCHCRWQQYHGVFGYDESVFYLSVPAIPRLTAWVSPP